MCNNLTARCVHKDEADSGESAQAWIRKNRKTSLTLSPPGLKTLRPKEADPSVFKDPCPGIEVVHDIHATPPPLGTIFTPDSRFRCASAVHIYVSVILQNL